jgi:hypothetical protein
MFIRPEIVQLRKTGNGENDFIFPKPSFPAVDKN